MKRHILVGIALFPLLGVAPTALAQEKWDVSALVGIVPSVDLQRHAPELTAATIDGGFTWGVEGSRRLSKHWSADALFMQQSSGLAITTSSGRATLFEHTVTQLMGNVGYRFGDAKRRVQPFAFGGFGATFFRADDVPNETKPAFNIGGGVKYFVSQAIGVRAHVRLTPTWLDDESSSPFCDPFGYCQRSLSPIEFAAGAVLRF